MVSRAALDLASSAAALAVGKAVGADVMRMRNASRLKPSRNSLSNARGVQKQSHAQSHRSHPSVCSDRRILVDVVIAADIALKTSSPSNSWLDLKRDRARDLP
jgi:hypothetical protein